MMKQLWKYSLVLLLAAVAGTALTACSGDDEDEIELDTDSALEAGGVSISLQLLNGDSIPVKTFREGEDILFMLTIANRGKEQVLLPKDVRELFGEELFQVFAADGTYMGKPWDIHGIIVALRSYIMPDESRSWKCYWLRDPRTSQFGMIKLSPRIPLPKGSYYSQFDIALSDGRKVTCRKDFKVI